jgi:hypothetical protein
MNIVEAYIKFNKHMIIIISGLSGSKKTKIAHDIGNFLNIEILNIEKHIIKDNEIMVELPNNISVKDWDDINTFNWDEINEIANSKKEKGLIICGPYFPTHKLKFSVDYFHIHIKTSKENLINSREKYILDNKDNESLSDITKHIDTPLFSKIISMTINNITYPHYIEYNKDSKIDKYINTKDLSLDEIFDKSIEFLFYKITEFLNNYDENNSTSKNNNNNNNASKSKYFETQSNSFENKSDGSSNLSSSDITSDTILHVGKYYGDDNIYKTYDEYVASDYVT